MAKNPWIAAVLSSLIPGLGQFYNNRFFRGILTFAVVVTVIGILVVSVIGIPFAVVLEPIFHLLAAYDAYTTTKRQNEMERLRTRQDTSDNRQ